MSLSSAKDRHRSGTLADQPAQCDYKRECKGVPQPAPAFLRQVEAVEVSTFDGWLREIAAEVPAKPIPFIIMLGQWESSCELGAAVAPFIVKVEHESWRFGLFF